MDSSIIMKNAENGNVGFFFREGSQDHFLFAQPKRTVVDRFFAKERMLTDLRAKDHMPDAVRDTIRKIKLYTRYINGGSIDRSQIFQFYL